MEHTAPEPKVKRATLESTEELVILLGYLNLQTYQSGITVHLYRAFFVSYPDLSLPFRHADRRRNPDRIIPPAPPQIYIVVTAEGDIVYLQMCAIDQYGFVYGIAFPGEYRHQGVSFDPPSIYRAASPVEDQVICLIPACYLEAHVVPGFFSLCG